jgi:hypothetical protein
MIKTFLASVGTRSEITGKHFVNINIPIICVFYFQEYTAKKIVPLRQLAREVSNMKAHVEKTKIPHPLTQAVISEAYSDVPSTHT